MYRVFYNRFIPDKSLDLFLSPQSKMRGVITICFVLKMNIMGEWVKSKVG